MLYSSYYLDTKDSHYGKMLMLERALKLHFVECGTMYYKDLLVVLYTPNYTASLYMEFSMGIQY